MKKILLLSDTHGTIDEQILKYVKEADEVWHAGDIGHETVTQQLSNLKPLFAVYGNIDNHECRIQHPEYYFLEKEGVKIIIIHIAGSFGKYNEKVKGLIQKYQPQILVCGHSHILKVAYDEKYNLLYVNPGAAGKHGFHKIRTLLRFELENSNIKNMDVIELGKRASV